MQRASIEIGAAFSKIIAGTLSRSKFNHHSSEENKPVTGTTKP
jgi:hypothetical protein